MATKKTKAGYDFIVAELKKNPNISYADIAAKAKRKKLVVYPVVYGRAKAVLGLVKVSPYGSKRRTTKSTTGARRGPGRPRKTESAALEALEDIVQRFREQERDLANMRKALEQIRVSIDGALTPNKARRVARRPKHR